MVLQGTEVKALRDGKASLVDAFATIDDGEVWLNAVHIAEYGSGTWTNHPPRRKRKLLMHRREIDGLIEKLRDGNLTLVPLSMYFSDGYAKVELAQGKRPTTSDATSPSAPPSARWSGLVGRRVQGM